MRLRTKLNLLALMMVVDLHLGPLRTPSSRFELRLDT